MSKKKTKYTHKKPDAPLTYEQIEQSRRPLSTHNLAKTQVVLEKVAPKPVVEEVKEDLVKEATDNESMEY